MTESTFDYGIESEIEYRTRDGHAPMTLASLESALQSIGYRLDRSMDCHGVDHYVTGVRAGCSYPCVTLYVRHAATGRGAFNDDAPRDANFARLQEWRLNQSHYAVHNNAIYDL